MPVYALGTDRPVIDPTAWVHPQAVIIGRVRIGPQASIWPCAVLRADFGAIEVGARTSVQDGTVVHAGADCPTIIGRDCVIGHNVHVEGCTVEDEVLVGSNSTVLPYCVLGRGSVVGASALLTKGTTVPARAIALGVPAEITLDAIDEGRWSAGVQRYVDLAARYANEMTAIPQPPA